MNNNELAKLYNTSYDNFEVNFIKLIKENSKNIIFINEIIDDLSKEIYKYNIKNGGKGYIYCLYNEVYKYYGENVYKLGMSNDVQKRLNGYTTVYIEESKILLQSKELSNYSIAEDILFQILEKY